MYHSKDDEMERGIVVTFQEEIEIFDMKIFTRFRCCKDRYSNVCLDLDGVTLGNPYLYQLTF